MVYGIYREEEVRMLSRGEIVVGDDGKKKMVLYRRHFIKFDYIPMEQIACIHSGDGTFRIKLNNGNVRYGWVYAKFGKIPTTLSELEVCYRETSMEPYPFGCYVIDEFVYVDDNAAERMEFNKRASYINGRQPKTIVHIANEVQDIYKGRMMTEDVVYDIQNYIFRELYNASNGEYALTDGVQVTLDAENCAANFVITDEAFKILADNNLL